MINRKPVGIKVFGIFLLIFNLIATYINLINIIAAGRPFLEHIGTLFIFTNLIIVIQSMVYFPISILFFINAIHILKLKSYAIIELFILIILNAVAYFITNSLIIHKVSMVLKDSVITILFWLILIYYFTRPHVKECFNQKKITKDNKKITRDNR